MHSIRSNQNIAKKSEFVINVGEDDNIELNESVINELDYAQ